MNIIKYSTIILFLYLNTLYASSISNKNKILFISSYNYSFPTISNQIKGIEEILDKKNYQIDIEFMDTKRFDPNIVEPLFYNTLKMKERLLKDYNVILVGDDNALHFIKKYQKEFFHKKPIVFLGINNILFAKEMAKNKYITGVLEESSIPETINLIETLHPSKNRILTIIDDTNTTKGILNSFTPKILEKLILLNISNFSFNEVKEKLETIPSGVPLLFISAFKDKNSKILEFNSSVNFIKKYTSSPIYHFYEHGIGNGLIGGKVIMFIDQGRKAAFLVKDIISGKNIENINLQKTENKYLFDYKEITKYNLLDKIPKNSTLINEPKSFLNQPILNILYEIIGFLIIISIWIIYLLYKLNKNSKKIINSYRDVQHIINGTVEGIILSKNNICTKVNTSTLELLNFKKDEIVGKNIQELFSKKYIDKFNHKLEKDNIYKYEANLINSEGKEIAFLIKEREIRLQNELIRISSILDLTEIKKKDELLQEQSKMLAIGEMIGNISHQWRQPLSVISSILNNWKAFEELGELNKKTIIEETDIIIENTQQLSSTIDDFMYFFKNENISSEFTVSELIDNILRLENSSLKMNNIKPIVNINSQTKLYLNRNKLLQAFINILNNSIEALSHNKDDNRILLISAKETIDNIIITIVDNAGGVEDEILNKIFEPYVSTKEQLNGFGLGLYMTYTILNKMNSQIIIENKKFTIKDIEQKGIQITITIAIKRKEDGLN